MAVIDAFPFFNEIDLLKLRLRVLNDHVDYFVITESTTTFSGQPKKLNFQEMSSVFSPYKDKIHYQIVDNVPNLSPFERDWFQRDRALEVIGGHFKDDDILIYGDVDEIPNPSAVHFASQCLSSEIKIAHLAQDLFYYYVNLLETSGTLLSYAGEYPGIKKKDRKWLGSVVTRVEVAKGSSMTALRNPEQKEHRIRIRNGGWHFSYMGGSKYESVQERIINKIESAAHQELNTEEIKSRVSVKTDQGRDIFNRRRSKFELQTDLSYLPVEALTHLNDLEHLIKK